MNKEDYAKNKIVLLKQQINNVRTDYINNLKPFIDSCLDKPITSNLLENVAEEIQIFAKRNNLNMSMYITTIDDQLAIFGTSVESQIIWDSLNTLYPHINLMQQ